MSGHGKPTLAVVVGTSRSSGGGHVYEEALLSLIRASSYVTINWNLKVVSARDGLFRNLEGYVRPPEEPRDSLSRNSNWKAALRRFRRTQPLSLENHLANEAVDLVYFASLNRAQRSFSRLPYISTVWDTGHRNLPEFPEFRGETWIDRERLLTDCLPRSFHTFTDSLHTSKGLCSMYSIDPDRVSDIGLLASVSPSLDPGLLPGNLRGVRYFIYPAKMWPHKNHVFLLRAFRQVADREPGVKLVFTGDDGGAQGKLVSEETRRLGLESKVLRMGFVDSQIVEALISESVALLMPTYLGPTNIPPLQALMLGTHAIVSDRHHFGPEIQSRLTVLPIESEGIWAEAMIKTLRSPPAVGRVIPDPEPAKEEIERVLKRFLIRRTSWQIVEG